MRLSRRRELSPSVIAFSFSVHCFVARVWLRLSPLLSSRVSSGRESSRALWVPFGNPKRLYDFDGPYLTRGTMSDNAPTKHLEANTVTLPSRRIMAMDVDSPSLPPYKNLKRRRDSRGHSRSSSWHSGEEELPLANERPHSSSGVSRSVSLSDRHSASHEESYPAPISNDEKRSHAAFRLFKYVHIVHMSSICCPARC